VTAEKTNIQDNFLNQLRKQERPARILLPKGKEIRGLITGFDQFTVSVQLKDTEVLVYKSAIAVIAPETASGPEQEETEDSSA